MLSLSLDRIHSDTLPWLVPHYIPRGHLTLLAADPALGKTSLLLHLATHLARATPPFPHPQSPGLPSPGSPQSSALSPQSSLLLIAHDHPHTLLRPRLEAMGATGGPGGDLARIHTAPTLDTLLPKSPADLPLESLYHLARAIPDLALLAIDPLQTYLAHNNPPYPGFPSIFHALADLALRLDIAIILTTSLPRELPRTLSPRTLLRLRGSLPNAALPRSILLLCEPQSPLTQSPPTMSGGPQTSRPATAATIKTAPSHSSFENRPSSLAPNRLLIPLKTPTPVLPPILPFHLSNVLTFTAPITREQLFIAPPPDSALLSATRFLSALLANGPMLAADITKAAQANHINATTLFRAKAHLRIDSQKQPTPRGAWCWLLPNDPRPLPKVKTLSDIANEALGSLPL